MFRIEIVGANSKRSVSNFINKASASSNEECTSERDNKTSKFVRIYTAYGICGAAYIKNGGEYKYDIQNGSQGGRDCSLSTH